MNSDAKARISCKTAIGSTTSALLAPASVFADDAEATCAGDGENDASDAETKDAAWDAATPGACTPAAGVMTGHRVGLL